MPFGQPDKGDKKFDSYAFCLVLNLLLAILIVDREEKRCRVREKELREKDVLIQDNLIRFSSFLS